MRKEYSGVKFNAVKLTVSFSDVEWDDAERGDPLESNIIREIVIDDDIPDFDDFLSDYLSDEFGFCQYGFNYSILSVEFINLNEKGK